MVIEWVLFFILCVIFICVFINHHDNDVIYTHSDVDNSEYLVRNVEDKQYAANMLAKIKVNIITLSDYLYTNIDNDKYKEYAQYIKQFHTRIRNCVIVESSVNSVYTSYSVNKGEQLVFCLRSKLFNRKLHDFNLVMYVVLHEIAHVACPVIGHGDLFKKIFAFLATVAVELNLYTKIDFKQNPSEYCGLTLSDSII